MFTELITLLIEMCSTILVAACLLRFYLHFLRINFAPNSGNPFSHFLLPLTNWLIVPIGKIIPAGGQIDIRSLLASYLLVLVKTLILLAIANVMYFSGQIAVIALFSLLDSVLSGLIGLLIVYVFFSWTHTHSPTQTLFYEMVEPLLRPIRKVSPKISGIDISPLILFILIELTSTIVNHAQKALFAAL